MGNNPKCLRLIPPKFVSHFTFTMDTEMADQTSAINLGKAEGDKTSKNAQKKAEKQERLAAQKANKSATNTTKEAGRSEAKKAVSKLSKKLEGVELVGITVAREDDFSGWYQQVLTKGDFLDYYDISGCYILKPASYFIWKKIQAWFGDRIEKIGVDDCAFPLFVSEEVLNREKAHIEGFAAEVAWVTHA